MAFELKPEESVRKGIRRIVRKQLKDVLEVLSDEHKGQRDEAVHEARKCFKRVRAVLRLVRPVVGEKIYRAENTCFRDAARPLTEVRDAKILVETLDQLVERFPQQIGGQAFDDVRKALQDHLRAVRKHVLDEQSAFGVVQDVVRQALDRVKDWCDMRNQWSSIGEGLEETYRRAGAAFDDAMPDSTAEKLHEWRKQTKYLRYQLEVLQPLWPARLGEMEKEADRLSELLGLDHDLVVLRQKAANTDEPIGEEEQRTLLTALIDRRRAELQEEAKVLGGRFFQDRPKSFARGLKGYWKAWQAETAAHEAASAQSGS